VTLLVAVIILAWAAPAGVVSQAPDAAACTALTGRSLPNTRLTAAQAVTTGSFTPPGTSNPIGNLPPFCRIAGVIAPTSESEILFEVWLPLEKWNGRFAGVGNGGWAGVISYPQIAEQLRRGYATASTNTGHPAGPAFDAAKFAMEKPEQLVDFAHRSHHETALKAKDLTQVFYGKAPDRSYFIGCSSGGYEGLMEAQRYPADYDAIVAGAPANNFTRLMAGDFDWTLAALQDPASALTLPALSLLHRRTIAACDASDGVQDGVLEDPRQCKFDPGTLACAAGQDPATCLTGPQIEAVRRIYAGPKHPTTGETLYPGLARGSEPFWVMREASAPFPIPISYFKWLVFSDPAWDWKTFKFTDPASFQAYAKADAKYAPIMNATNPDLRAFKQRGGKLLQYHGWNDQLISPSNSVTYYESVLALSGTGQTNRAETLRDVQSFYRLFMVPGLAHCGGGVGPIAFDMQVALEQWVERGIAPDRVITTRVVNGIVDRSRPLCPYPQVSTYKGQGDTNDAANFACVH